MRSSGIARTWPFGGAGNAANLGTKHAARVMKLVTLDIAPTLAMYDTTTDAFARAYWHWFFLILPAPQPERMIGADRLATRALDVEQHMLLLELEAPLLPPRSPVRSVPPSRNHIRIPAPLPRKAPSR